MNTQRRGATLSLRSNTYASIMCSLLLAVAIVFAALVYTTRANVVASELRAANDQASRLHDTVNHELESLDVLAFDWARWDEAYAYTNGENPEFVQEYLRNSWNEIANVHLVIITNEDGRVLFSWQDEPFPEASFPQSDILAAPADSSGFIVSGPSVMMVSSQPIERAAGGEPKGRFVFGKLLDLKEMARLSGIDGAPTVTPASTASSGFTGEVTPASPTRAKLTRPHNLTVYSLVCQPSGRPAGVIAAPVSSVGYEGAPRLVSGIVATLLIVGITWGAVTVGLVERFSLSRISWLKAGVFALGERQGEALRLRLDSAHAEDEISSVAAEINVMLDKLEEARTAERQSEMRCAALIENMVDAVIVLDSTGRIAFASRQATRLTGRSAEELMQMSYTEVFGTSVDDELEDLLTQVLDSRKGITLEAAVRTADGRTTPVELSVSQFIEGDSIEAVQLIARDITDRKRFEAQLLRLANHDHLTGLFNRKRFEEELSRELAESTRRGTSGALLWLDLDRFKEINDAFGHHAGDAVLTALADALRGACRAEQPVGRLGGDEFAVLVPHCTLDEAKVAAKRILEAIRGTSVLHEGQPIHLTASLGIALYPNDGITVEDLLSHADLAMYKAKQGGANQCRHYALSDDRQAEVTERHAWATRLERALQEDGLVAYSQPVLDLHSGLTLRHELLIRLREDGRIIEPAEFLEHAESLSLVNDIDRWMVTEAMSLVRSRISGDSPVSVAVNLSGNAFADRDFLDFIERSVLEDDTISRHLAFEITETALIRHMAVAVAFIKRLQAAGCSVCLDDFGSGFSSFYYLRNLPVGVLKIDRELTHNLTTDRKNQHLVRAIVELSHGLGMTSTAEGVESAEMLELLMEMGVDSAQGYFIGRPRPAREALSQADDITMTSLRAIDV